MLRFDINLVFTIVNLLVLYFLMKKFLFGRVNKIIDARKTLIDKQFSDAREAQENADTLKAEYENKLADAKTVGGNIVAEAKVKAKEEGERMLAAAEEELAQKRRKAEEELGIERANALRDMKKEIATLVIDAATKVVDDQNTITNNQKLYDKFLAEAGEANGANVQ